MEKSSGSDWGVVWGGCRQRLRRGMELWWVPFLPAKNNLYSSFMGYAFAVLDE